MKDVARDWIKSIGLCLTFVGMQFNTALKNIFPGADAIVFIMILSIFLLMDVRQITRFKIDVRFFIILCFQVCLLFFSVFSGNGTAQLISFHVYLIAFIIALNSNMRENISFNAFGRALFYLTGLISLVVVYQATDGFTKLIMSYHATGKLWLSSGGDPITMSRSLEVNIISILLYKKRNLLEKIFAVVFIISDIIGMFSFGNRSTIVCSVVVVLLWYTIYNNRKMNGISILKTISIVVLAMLAVRYIPYLDDKISSIYNSVLSGIRTLLGIQTNVIDSSAQTRVMILDRELEDFFGNNFMKNALFGLGYNHAYVDRPLIQAFLDLGFLGGILYTILLVIVPVKWLILELRHKYNFNSAWIYVIFISIQYLVDNIITGLPYYYSLWIPPIFILYSVTNKNSYKISI